LKILKPSEELILLTEKISILLRQLLLIKNLSLQFMVFYLIISDPEKIT